jgi:hypothetical protein
MEITKNDRLIYSILQIMFADVPLRERVRPVRIENGRPSDKGSELNPLNLLVRCSNGSNGIRRRDERSRSHPISSIPFLSTISPLWCHVIL